MQEAYRGNNLSSSIVPFEEIRVSGLTEFLYVIVANQCGEHAKFIATNFRLLDFDSIHIIFCFSDVVIRLL
ncbi:Hypothetical predicted protein [Octopus vulgaris]|uniref:Uncharacterized protein n=1 Tax=Octopus vulgaris TaxID=6645 RepID=A0AA36FGN5_OCTVU|nr:Hypothetical predicted protein [Octopus vulgaris]